MPLFNKKAPLPEDDLYYGSWKHPGSGETDNIYYPSVKNIIIRPQQVKLVQDKGTIAEETVQFRFEYNHENKTVDCVANLLGGNYSHRQPIPRENFAEEFARVSYARLPIMEDKFFSHAITLAKQELLGAMMMREDFLLYCDEAFGGHGVVLLRDKIIGIFDRLELGPAGVTAKLHNMVSQVMSESFIAATVAFKFSGKKEVQFVIGEQSPFFERKTLNCTLVDAMRTTGARFPEESVFASMPAEEYEALARKNLDCLNVAARASVEKRFDLLL